MALKIRTADGKTFHRCGIKFTGDPIVVSEEELDKRYGSPEPSKKNPILVGEVLLAERMLVCEIAEFTNSGQEDPPPQTDPPPKGAGDKKSGKSK